MNACVVQLEGDIDLSVRARVTTQLRSAVEEAIAADRDLSIDASRVTFMDSTGIGLVVEASLAMSAEGHDVHLSGAPEIVRRVFEITGLSALIVD